MATGSGGLSRTLLGGHEELFDWICNQCDDSGKISEAAVFCEDCARGYCQPCWKVHGQFPLMQHHRFLGRDRVQDWGGTARATGSGVSCQDHAEEHVSLYCGNHDAICCPVCVSLDHRDCKKMHYIPKISQDIQQQPEYKATDADLDKALSEVKTACAKMKTAKKTLDASRSNTVQTIKDFRQDVLAAFVTMATNAMTETNTVYNALEDKLNDEMKVCGDLESELDGMKQRLHTTTGKDAQRFVNMKTCQKEIPKITNAMMKLTTDPALYKFHIALDGALSELIHRQSMGNIVTELPINTHYSVKKQMKVNIQSSGDADSCFISGFCQLPTGRIMCSDYNNKKVKLLGGSSYTVIDSCQVAEKPRGLTCTVYPEAAVVLKNRTIQLLSIVNDKIAPTRSFPVGSNCYGLAYHTGRFYVSNMSEKVFVYDISGLLLFTIDKDASGSALFSNPRNVAVSADGSRVHVADVNKGVITVDRDGKHLTTLTHPCLQGPFGLCLDNYDSVLVSGYDSGNIVHVGKGGDQVIREVALGQGALNRPISTCHDRYLNRLLVACNPQSGGDSVTVFEFK